MVGGVHSLAPATWLSGTRPDKGSAGASMSTTLDQVVAQHIGQDTTLPSLELASETTQQAAACSGSACFYNTTLSFRDAAFAAADGVQPAQGLRAAVRRRRHAARSGPRSRARRRACSTASTTARARCGAIWVRAIGSCWTTTWTRCGRSSGACSWRRAATCRASTCPKAPIGELTRSTSRST